METTRTAYSASANDPATDEDPAILVSNALAAQAAWDAAKAKRQAARAEFDRCTTEQAKAEEALKALTKRVYEQGRKLNSFRDGAVVLVGPDSKVWIPAVADTGDTLCGTAYYLLREVKPVGVPPTPVDPDAAVVRALAETYSLGYDRECDSANLVVADVCDHVLDRSGQLLNRVRDAVHEMRRNQTRTAGRQEDEK